MENKKTAREYIEEKWSSGNHKDHCMDDIYNIMESYALYRDKANLGMATTSELIYELSARCDTGNIDLGGKYKPTDY